MTVKSAMAEFRAMDNTDYKDPDHRNKAYASFMNRNKYAVELALNLYVVMDELELIEKVISEKSALSG